MPRKVFVAGEILTAADVNTNLMDQAVMVFDDSAARTTAIPTPSEGMVTYLKDTNAVEKYDGAAFVNVDTGKILQVVSTTLTTSFSFNTATFVDVTGLTASITPSSTSSKILIFLSIGNGGDLWNTGANIFQLRRDSTDIAVSSVLGTMTMQSLAGSQGDTATNINVIATNFLDTPATTSAITYGVQARVGSAAQGYVNRNNTGSRSTISTITVLEIAG